VTQKQALGALLLMIGLITAGFTWRWGDYGLYAGAVMVGLLVSFINIEKGDGGGA
jgi:hypothetical protein